MSHLYRNGEKVSSLSIEGLQDENVGPASRWISHLNNDQLHPRVRRIVSYVTANDIGGFMSCTMGRHFLSLICKVRI